MKQVRAFVQIPEVLPRVDKTSEILGINFSKLVVKALKKYISMTLLCHDLCIVT